MLDTKPLISIIVPVFNAQAYLEKCVHSLCKQTYSNIEILLINDGSTDDSLKYCDKLAQCDSRIRVHSQMNKGIGAVRNWGLRLAHGEYIGFVDSDDWIEPDMYESLWKLMQFEKADVACCPHYREEIGRTRIIEEVTRSFVFTQEEAFEALREGKFILNFVWDKLFRREVFEEVVFPEERRFEDLVISPHWLSNVQKVVYLSEPKYHYLVRNGSLTNGLDEFDMKWRYEMVQALVEQRNFCFEKGLWKRAPKKLFRSCAHLSNRLIFLPPTSINTEMHNYCMTVVKEYDSVKGLGFEYKLKRYLFAYHWSIYAKVYYWYRTLFRKK